MELGLVPATSPLSVARALARADSRAHLVPDLAAARSHGPMTRPTGGLLATRALRM
jgi:hypothetical protein